jgi:PAS domain S-box-containing protein
MGAVVGEGPPLSQSSPLVHIAIVRPRPGSAQRDLGTASALDRLGREARLEVLHDADSCCELAAREILDLVILEEGVGEGETLQVLGALRGEGPPVIVVTTELDEELALDLFRRGAADCIAATSDYAEVLPVVALEQIRRWRAARERGDAERRIRWLEQLHEAIVNEIPAALVVLDEQGKVVTVNPEFSQIWGVSSDEVQGRPLEDLLPLDFLEGEGVGEVLSRAAEGRSVAPRIARVIDGERGMRAFDVRAKRLGEGRILLVLSDLTEVELLAKQVADLQRYNENIIQNMNSALLVVDLEGRITYANPTAEQILETVPGGLRGRPVWEWFPDAPREEVLISRTLEENTRFRGAETVISRPTGRIVPIGISCAPMSDRDGTRLGAVAIFQDLTEMKQLQRQVLQTEKMASIGQLAAGVAHEINNPMGFIHANLCQMSEYLDDLAKVWDKVEALRKAVQELHPPQLEEGGSALGAAPSVPEEIQCATGELDIVIERVEADFLISDFGKAVRESLEGSERIRHIVQDLRAFSHQDTAELAEADLNQCLDSTANIVWTMMKHSVSLTKQYDELPPVYCFPMQLKQVFMNLIVNAYQAIEARAGGEEARGEIRLRTELRDDAIAIVVTDNGTGIAPDALGRIFDPFFTTKEVGVGTGLGLSTSFNIVRRHGGTIRVESTEGQGTSFEVLLPLESLGPEAGRVR